MIFLIGFLSASFMLERNLHLCQNLALLRRDPAKGPIYIWSMDVLGTLPITTQANHCPLGMCLSLNELVIDVLTQEKKLT